MNQAVTQWLTIDRQQFLHNITLLQDVLQSPIAVVVKGNGYGHGIQESTRLFYQGGIRVFCTYHAATAIQMKKKFPDCRWIAMGPVSRRDEAVAIEHDIELFVWDKDYFARLARQAAQVGKPALLHCEVETGMYRTGLSAEWLATHVGEIIRNPHLHISGICTHFSGADEEDNLARIDHQKEQWIQLKRQLMPQLPYAVDWHGESSSASIYLSRGCFSMARVGILAYGFFPSDYALKQWNASTDIPRPSLSLMGAIIGYNQVPKGEYSGYGKSYQAKETSDTIIVPVGYADGFPRALSNQWTITVKGTKFAQVGRVNMNMVVAKATHELPGRYEPATLIHKEGINDWYEAAKRSGRFIYELLCCLSPHLPRFVV